MKILHITNRLSEGGVESFLLTFLPCLKRLGHEVELLVLDKSAVSMRTMFETQGIKVHIGKYSNVYNLLNVFEVRRYLCLYDIVHVHLWPAQLYISLGKNISHSYAKFVTTEHNNFNKRRKFKFYRWVEQWMYNQYDVIAGVCEASRCNLLKWINHPRVVSIPNGIDRECFIKALPYHKEEFGLSSSSFMIVMTARFFAQKDHKTLIKAMALLDADIHLFFIGSGDAMADCQQLAIDLNIDGRVHFLGRRTDVKRILKTADLCVLSTHYEGLPISIIEYMAAGKTVIATNVDGVKEMLPVECLCETENPADMANKIKTFLLDSQRLESMAERNNIESSKYDISNMVNQYNNIYNE